MIESPQETVILSSPQYIGGSVAHQSSDTDAKCNSISMVRHPQALIKPSALHPQAYSPNLVSTTGGASYIPPPSPTPSQSHIYSKFTYYSDESHTLQHPQQHSYRQEQLNSSRMYPTPELVDSVQTITLSVDPASSKPPTKSINKSKNSLQKKILWIMSIITLILIGAIIGIVVSMKSKNNNDSGSTQPPSSGEKGTVSAPPLPTWPSEKGKCPSFFCHNYYWTTCVGACKEDSQYESCKDGCNGEFFCIKKCEKGVKCFDDCFDNLAKCQDYCF